MANHMPKCDLICNNDVEYVAKKKYKYPSHKRTGAKTFYGCRTCGNVPLCEVKRWERDGSSYTCNDIFHMDEERINPCLLHTDAAGDSIDQSNTSSFDVTNGANNGSFDLTNNNSFDDTNISSFEDTNDDPNISSFEETNLSLSTGSNAAKRPRMVYRPHAFRRPKK